MRVTELYRYPIKAHGREAVETVELIQGQTMPMDRVWAVAHEASKFDPQNPSWTSCSNFTRGAKAHGLQAMEAVYNAERKQVTLTHPTLGELTIDPDTKDGSDALIAWTEPLVPQARAQSSFIAKVDGRGMTDSDYPTISIANHASRAALSDAAMIDLEADRFRANIWFNGAPAWEEFNWIGKTITLGTSELKIEERIERCRATTVDTKTGASNFDTLALLERLYGHRDFGIFGVVTKTGTISVGDTLELQ